MDAWSAEVRDQVRGWQYMGDQFADDLFTLGGTIRFTYLEPMPPEWGASKNKLKAIIRDLLWAIAKRKEVNFRDVERNLRDVHSHIRDLANCALQAAEFDDQTPYLDDLRTRGREVPEEIGRLTNLAERRSVQSLHVRALSLGGAASRLAREAFGEESFEFADSLARLGHLYRKTGSFGKAEQAFKPALEVDRERSGKKSPDFAVSLHNLAGLLQQTGRYSEAESTYK